MSWSGSGRLATTTGRGSSGHLHRISALRNRRGDVIGLTRRVGRAVRGTVAMVRDVIEQGNSILILGRPGVGKTTLLREAARVLADELGKRVVVVEPPTRSPATATSPTPASAAPAACRSPAPPPSTRS